MLCPARTSGWTRKAKIGRAKYRQTPNAAATRAWPPVAARGAPSVLPLSASTTSYGTVVAERRVPRNSSSAAPGEYVTTTTRTCGPPVTLSMSRS